MKNLRGILTALALLFSNLTIAQNNYSFFKTIPVIDHSTPAWAQKMYSDNSNIKEVDWEYYHYSILKGKW